MIQRSKKILVVGLGVLGTSYIKAIRYLNWTPKRSLKDMCKDGWKWQNLNPNGFEI